MKLRLLADQNWHDKIALVRVDYNVPLITKNNHSVVQDPRRIQASFPTITTLLAKNNKVILMSHFGRPASSQQKEFSLQPIFTYLKQNTSWNLEFIADYTDAKTTKDFITNAPPQTVFLLENLRFHSGEEKNDPQFVSLLASLGNVYVDDAFSSAHRPHASVYGLAQALPAAAGLALQGEIQAFSDLLEHPKHPFIVIVGGAKISDKIDPIVNLAKIADAILIGGGVANNFLKAVGLAIQKSYLQDSPADLKKVGLNYVEVADHIVEENLGNRLLKDGYIPLPKIIYPVDVVAATSIDAKNTQLVSLTNKDKICNRCDLMYLDIGPKTTKLYKELILQAETVFWNGPMGVYEKPLFSRGTKEIARAIAKTSALTLAGGGDTIDALDRFQYYKQVDYVSMAGSAALEFLSGKVLPGVAVLTKSKS
jgi:phosphoglycerate kinase